MTDKAMSDKAMSDKAMSDEAMSDEAMSYEALSDRLAVLETAEATRTLVAAYAAAVDGKDLDGLGGVFAPGAVLRSPNRHIEGFDAIADYFGATFAANPCAARHFVTTVRVVDVTASSASAHSYFLYTTASAGTSIFGWGRYEDRIAVVDGRLRIVDKYIEVDHTGSLHAGWADRLAAEVATR
jgi:ketosteroid isomerase-like protein